MSASNSPATVRSFLKRMERAGSLQSWQEYTDLGGTRWWVLKVPNLDAIEYDHAGMLGYIDGFRWGFRRGCESMMSQPPATMTAHDVRKVGNDGGLDRPEQGSTRGSGEGLRPRTDDEHEQGRDDDEAEPCAGAVRE